MNGGLIDNVNSEYYHAEAVLRGIPHFAHVIVEDESDVPFWNHILKLCQPDYNFELSPYSYSSSTTKGKEHIIHHGSEGRLGKYLIGCVDSDLDYLLPHASEQSRTIQDCAYLLQTYAYSTENLHCSADGLNSVCINATSDNCEFDFKATLRRLSQICYPLLLRWLFLAEQNLHHVFNADQWGEVLDSSHTLDGMGIDDLLKMAQTNVDHYCHTIDAILPEDFSTFADKLIRKFGIDPESTLLYVRGHNLFKYVLRVLIEPICNQIKSNHIKLIKSASSSDEECNNLIKHYQKIEETKHCERLLKQNYSFMETIPWIRERLFQDVARALEIKQD